jgi:hypothetical protein
MNSENSNSVIFNTYSFPPIEKPCITIDPRSLLEVIDPKHRYGKHLREYYLKYQQLCNPQFISSNFSFSQHFLALNSLTFQEKVSFLQPFFSWLDDPIMRSNSAENEIPETPFVLLDSEIVKYLHSEEDRSQFQYQVNEQGLLEHFKTGQLLTTKSSTKGDMFVVKDNYFFISCKIIKSIPRFHHSSFFGGESVDGVGLLTCENGQIKTLFPHSGHYRPMETHLYWLLDFLKVRKLDLSKILVDAQRIYKVSRHNSLPDNGGKDVISNNKAKKMDCLYLMEGNYLYEFLNQKYRIRSFGLLQQLQTPQVLHSVLNVSNLSTENVLLPPSSTADAAPPVNFLQLENFSSPSVSQKDYLFFSDSLLPFNFPSYSDDAYMEFDDVSLLPPPSSPLASTFFKDCVSPASTDVTDHLTVKLTNLVTKTGFSRSSSKSNLSKVTSSPPVLT